MFHLENELNLTNKITKRSFKPEIDQKKILEFLRKLTPNELEASDDVAFIAARIHNETKKDNEGQPNGLNDLAPYEAQFNTVFDKIKRGELLDHLQPTTTMTTTTTTTTAWPASMSLPVDADVYFADVDLGLIDIDQDYYQDSGDGEIINPENHPIIEVFFDHVNHFLIDLIT